MRFLLDTNIITEVLKKFPDQKVLQWVSSLEIIYMSVITWEELIFGLKRRNLLKKESWLRQLMDERGEVYPVTKISALWCGEKRAELELSGQIVTQADCLIAACAWEKGLIMATRNTKDFQGFGIPLYNPFIS